VEILGSSRNAFPGERKSRPRSSVLFPIPPLLPLLVRHETGLLLLRVLARHELTPQILPFLGQHELTPLPRGCSPSSAQ
jgi:hypothetical protein